MPRTDSIIDLPVASPNQHNSNYKSSFVQRKLPTMEKPTKSIQGEGVQDEAKIEMRKKFREFIDEKIAKLRAERDLRETGSLATEARAGISTTTKEGTVEVQRHLAPFGPEFRKFNDMNMMAGAVAGGPSAVESGPVVGGGMLDGGRRDGDSSLSQMRGVHRGNSGFPRSYNGKGRGRGGDGSFGSGRGGRGDGGRSGFRGRVAGGRGRGEGRGSGGSR